jgi:hypothetical protein
MKARSKETGKFAKPIAPPKSPNKAEKELLEAIFGKPVEKTVKKQK